MGWWIAGAVVVASLVALAAVLAVLRRRLQELGRVAALGRERAGRAQLGLPASVGAVRAALAGVQTRAAALRRRPATGGGRRAAPGP
jgi:hypothetical protein